MEVGSGHTFRKNFSDSLLLFSSWSVYILQRVVDVPAVARKIQVPEQGSRSNFFFVEQEYRTSQELLIPIPALMLPGNTMIRAAEKLQPRQNNDVQWRHTVKKVFPGTLLLTLMLIFPLPTMARVDIDIHISLPPPVRFVEPPELVVMPGTYVYTAPDVDADIFFCDGWWWRSWEALVSLSGIRFGLGILRKRSHFLSRGPPRLATLLPGAP